MCRIWIYATLTLSGAIFVLSDSEGFCNDTSVSVVQTKCTNCALNSHITCPEGTTQLTTGKGDKDCSFTQKIGTHMINMNGCRHKCEQVTPVPSCCDGYWGSQCEECVGGADNPCYGRGLCIDGYEGNGICTCLDAFNGTACEFCTDERMYGQECNMECQCVNGTCNNGPEGDGSCECYFGYTGKLCDTEIPGCDNVTCADDAKCVMVGGNATCVCEDGYEEVDMEGCVAIDACQSSPCDDSANCVSTGPNLYRCTCKRGYQGDGFYCYPINKCRENAGGCVRNTSTCVYRGPGEHECICMFGYEKYQPGVGCSLTDMCEQTVRPCDKNANCTTVEPGRFECVCHPGYIGDGKLCYGNLLQVLEKLNEAYTDPVTGNSLGIATTVLKSLAKDLLTEHGPLTIFVPIDKGFKSVSRRGLMKNVDSFIKDEDRARQIIFQHIIAGELQMSDMANSTVFYTLQGSSAELQARGSSFRFKLHGTREKARILKSDIVASNGIIHIINSLLTNQPDQMGNKSQNLFDLINSEGRHNRFIQLIRAARIESWLTSNNLTVFTPSNGAWNSLPEGSLDYLQSPKGRERLISLLQNHIFPVVVTATDLINLRRLKSLDGSSVTIKVSKVGQILLNGVAHVSQTNIPGKNGIYHHIDSVLLPEGITSILPNKCDKSVTRLVWGSCGPCLGTMTCPGSSEIPLETGCKYWVKARARYIALQGCSVKCNKTVVIPQCCPDFYGPSCKPCPGAFKQICSGHGRCMDGYSFDGKCVCDKAFDGQACHLCADKKMFGANCSQECTCLYGNCDNGPQGSGKCKEGSCADGYWGDNCELKETVCGKRALACHAHSVCVSDSKRSSCVCKPGYEGNGVDCQEVDPCIRPDRGGCHAQASCMKTGPGMRQCTCDDGWMGDGISYCYRTTACVSSLACHTNASCKVVAPRKFICICDAGFQGNGSYCSPTNPCSVNNGGCHAQAACTYLGMGKANCTCPDNYGGDGRSCYSSIQVEVTQYPELSQFANLFSKIDPEDNVVSDMNGSYTLFAPNDDAMMRFKEKAPANFWEDEGNILTLQGYHLLSGSYTILRLKQLTELMSKVNTMADGMSANVSVINDKEVYVNDARVVQGDIPAVNGYIHIIDKVLEPYPVSVDQPSLEDFFMVHPEYSMFRDSLKETGLFKQVDDMESYTLFLPTNSFLKNNNISTENSRFLSLFIVPKLLLSTTISDGQMENTILGSRDQLQFTRKGTDIYVNGVLIKRPNMPTDGGVIHGIEGIIRHTIHHCDVKMELTDGGSCVSCQRGLEASVCPDGYTRAKRVFIRTDCTYAEPGVNDKETKYLGCQSWCSKVSYITDCCSGYYGAHCEECPGGADSPCNNRGVCTSTGTCDCHERFGGPACESCAAGWTGENCSIEKTSCDYNNGGCSSEAVCSKVDGTIMCVCKPGYIGTNGSDCRPPCAYHNGGCHPKARCIYQDNRVTCECTPGYRGDGKRTCSEDVCKLTNGPCSQEKFCTYISIGKWNETVQCTCAEDYRGNITGTFCINRSIFEAIKSLAVTKQFYQELTDQDVISQLQSLDGNKTLFLPVDSSMKGPQLTTEDIKNHIINGRVMVEKRWWYDYNNTFETEAGQLIAITDLNSQYYVNGIQVLNRNLNTANGLVHIIAQPLWVTSPPSTSEPQVTGTSTEETPVTVQIQETQSKTSITAPIVGAVLGLLVLSAVVVLAVWLWKGKATGFMQLRKRFRKGSDNSLSLARIHSDQDEDLDALDSPQVKKYNNPLYNVKDDYDNLDDD